MATDVSNATTVAWLWQNGTTSADMIRAAATRLDGSYVLAGHTKGDWSGTNAGNADFAAVNLDADGAEVWRYQDGTAGVDSFRAAAVDQEDGSVVLAGTSSSNVTDDLDFFVGKLDAEGTVLWRFQDGTGENDTVHGISMAEDGSVVIAGETGGNWDGTNAGDAWQVDFAAFRLDTDGTEVWRYQNGTEVDDELQGAAMVDGDKSVVMAGQTWGNFAGSPKGSFDFIAIKLDAADGTEIWRWQGGSTENDFVTAIAATEDDGVVLAGATSGNWSGDHAGSADFAAVKLNSEGVEVWSYQGGTSMYDLFMTIVVQQDGSVLIGGWTGGSWSGVNAGTDSYDWAVISLSADGEEEWRWQGGSTESDDLGAMTAGPDGKILVAGSTEGAWESTNLGDNDFIAVMLNTNTMATPAPSAPNDASLSPSPVPTPTPPSAGDSNSDTTPMIAGVVSAVGGVALIALLGTWRWRQNSKKAKPQPCPPVTSDPEQAPDASCRSKVSAAESDGRSPHGKVTAPSVHAQSWVQGGESDGGGVGSSSTSTIAPASAPAPPAPASALAPASAPAPASPQARAPTPVPEVTATAPTTAPAAAAAAATGAAKVVEPVHTHPTVSSRGGSDTLTRELTEEKSAQESSTENMSTVSTPNISTVDRGKFDQLRGGQTTASAATIADDSTPEDLGKSQASSTASRRGSGDGIGLGQAVMDAAMDLAKSSQIPGVSEAATALSIVAKMVSNSRDTESDARLRRCRSIVRMLGQASEVAEKGGTTTGQIEGGVIDDVHETIQQLVELIKTYQSKNKLSRVLTSTHFKRRQSELYLAVKEAVATLQLGLQVQVCHDVSTVKGGIHLYQGSIEEATLKSLAEARRARRQRKLDEVEIPADQVVVTDEMLGRGGFGEVFVADFNGLNAAAKVLYVSHDLGKRGDVDALEDRNDGRPDAERERQRRAFWREMEAMIHLRSPHTVNVYGAVTSLPDRLILVMELLAGGDLRTLLKDSEQPLTEKQSRRIVGDICAGMTFLHGKETVHGDLKSANILLDLAGRAKIGDFGTSRWSQHTNSTGLATYTKSQNTQMSLAWSAPEVLGASGSTYGDVYSFGIVAWEVLSRELPWASVTHAKDVHIRVVLNDLRPGIPAEAPADLADMMRACWAAEPKARPAFSSILKDMKSNGWSE